jgi:methanogenic corrinoid protein MtbC1
MISKALESGHRAGDVVPLSAAELEDLLSASGVVNRSLRSGEPEAAFGEVLSACRAFDRDELIRILRRDASALGVATFLRERVAPLLEQIGEEWSRGGIGIRHEHFFSEVLEDELRLLRAPLDVATTGRPVVLASLPNEMHALGLQIVALAISAAGRSVRVLGPHLPADEIVSAAEALDAVAVGISVSVLAPLDETARELAAVRNELPAGIQLWVGGAGATQLLSLPDGVELLPALDDLDRAVSALSV